MAAGGSGWYGGVPPRDPQRVIDRSASKGERLLQVEGRAGGGGAEYRVEGGDLGVGAVQDVRGEEGRQERVAGVLGKSSLALSGARGWYVILGVKGGDGSGGAVAAAMALAASSAAEALEADAGRQRA